ncbi:hypothetical protein HDR58_01910 [bacterium]|nr:hypothetical protein [bacterium]
MATPENLPQFVAEYLKRHFPKIYKTQEGIAASRIYGRKAVRADNGKPRSRSGALMAALQAAPASINAGTSGIEAFLSYPYYIRFLDMKRFGNNKIYNRPIWGILYKQTFVDLKFDLAAWLRESTASDIRQSYQ